MSSAKLLNAGKSNTQQLYAFRPLGKPWESKKIAAWTANAIWGTKSEPVEDNRRSTSSSKKRRLSAKRFLKQLLDVADLDNDKQLSFTEAMLLLRNRQVAKWVLPICLAVDGDWAVGYDKKETLVASNKSALGTNELRALNLMQTYTLKDTALKRFQDEEYFSREMVFANAVFYSRWAVCGLRACSSSGVFRFRFRPVARRGKMLSRSDNFRTQSPVLTRYRK
jgi:hypothetical protein